MSHTTLRPVASSLLFCLAALSVGAAAFAAEPAESPRVFRAGAATSNVTPWLGEPIVGGWNSPPAEHIHDELHARCLALDDGRTRIAIVVVDSLGMNRETFDEAKRQIEELTGIPPDHVLTSATHTHSATSARSKNVLSSEGDFSNYQRFVARRLAEGVRRAVNQLEPAKVAWGAADEPRHVFNRRWYMQPGTPLPNPFGGQDQVKMNPGNDGLLKPAGPTDPQVSFLSLQASDGRPIALLANYSLHYVGGTGPSHISADYFAMFADRIQQLLQADRLDPPFVGIMSNGTSGNINNISFGQPRPRRAPYEQMRRVANDLADVVFAEYQKLEHRDWVPLAMRQREVELAVRKPTEEQLARAKEVLAHPDWPDKLPHEQSYAGRIVAQHESPPTVKILLQAIRIGELGICAIPFETFAETGLELKARSPLKPAFTISQANGSYGYLPTPEQHQLGGYETWLGTSKVEIEASTKIVDNLLDMLAELKQE